MGLSMNIEFEFLDLIIPNINNNLDSIKAVLSST